MLPNRESRKLYLKYKSIEEFYTTYSYFVYRIQQNEQLTLQNMFTYDEKQEV